MSIAESFVLPEDVVVFHNSELGSDLQERTPDPDSYVVTRLNARQASTIVDRAGAELIEGFRKASTIVDAVIEFSRGRELNPREVLDEAFPLLRQLMTANFLVPEGSRWVHRIVPTLNTGDDFNGWRIEQSVHLIDDTEVYRVHSGAGSVAALKVARPGHEEHLRAALRHEASILSLIGGGAAPHVFDVGDRDGCPFMISEWCDGVPVAALARRMQHEQDSPARLLELCGRILRAYAALHATGVVHGDIHPNNLLATEEGAVRILDFGHARVIGDPGPLGAPPRAGAAFYFDPQYATAMLAGEPPPPADRASDQYSLAALLRELVVGQPYLDFSIEHERMLRQIIEDPPVSFIRHGTLPWPDVEGPLNRALAKNPLDRFASIDEFAEKIASARPRNVLKPKTAPRHTRELFAEVLDGLAINGRAFARLDDPDALCSVNTGAAGVAYALYRIASLRENPELLALAEIWIDRAERRADDDAAFYCRELDLTPENIGSTSLFHSSAGLACVEALVALANGDRMRAGAAAQRFVTRARLADGRLDVTIGGAGLLLGCAGLIAMLPSSSDARDAVVALGDSLDANLRGAIAVLPAPGLKSELNFGIAHGWGGVLFALLRWREVFRRSGADALIEARLRELAAHGEAYGAGLRWRWDARPAPNNFMSGWCNGSAGLVHLWTLAERSLGGHEYDELARRCGLYAFEAPADIGDLCCGSGGCAYAMLDLYRHTGDAVWLARARDLGERAATLIGRWALRADSLYKGSVGVALLIADLERPELSCMPLFDREP